MEDSKAKNFLAFLKELDFVKVEKEKPAKKKKKAAVKQKKKKDPDFPYFGMCPDWDIEAEELRYGGVKKRLEGWL